MDTDLLYNSSDAVNRHGFRFAITGLELSVKEIFNKGLPMLVGHDFHRPIGWTVPFGVLIEPGLGRMIARRMLATNGNEQRAVNRALQNYLHLRFNERFDQFKEPFFQLLGDTLANDFQQIDCSCVAILQTAIAPKLFKKIFERQDYDGLINVADILADFEYKGQGIFKHKSSDLCVFANDFFRRSQSRFNNFNAQFLDQLLSLKDQSNISLKLRLDADLIGYFPSAHQSMELEYHWGPKYNDDISTLKTGLTKYGSLDGQRTYSGVAGMEFYWKRDDHEITFEAEELMDNPSPQSDDVYRCRYVHSIYDNEKQQFFHFDGAFRSYGLEEMLDRIGKNFVEYGRKADYQKMFRLDGKISLNIWKSLITHYYHGNELIYEYFGLAGEREAQKLKAPVLTPLQRILPYANLVNEGIRVFLSYHELPNNIKSGRYVDIFDVMVKKDGEKLYSLEHTIYELKAVLYQLGQSLEIPNDIDLIKIDDEFWNIPSIMHYGEDDHELLHKTVEALTILFSGMVKRKILKVISLTLSFTLNRRVVRISAVGAVEELLTWLKDTFPIAFTEEALTAFTDKQRKYLEKYTAHRNKITADFLLQDDGVLYIKRNAVLFPYQTDFDESNQLRFKIEFPPPKDDPDKTFELMREGKIGVGLAVAIENCYWSDTKENYLTSNRSKFLNNNQAYVMIDQCSPLALYWVKKHLN
jgi:hypothetical protein